MRHPIVRRLVAAVAILFATSIWILADAIPASAHAVLVGSTPGTGEAVPTAPKTITVKFSEPVETALGAIRVFGPKGNRVDVGAVTHPEGRGDTVQTALAGDLAEGTYTVSWSVVSADSHPVQGAYTFGIGSGAVSTALSPEATRDQRSQTVSVLYAVARWVSFAGFALVVGAAYFVAVCWPAAGREPRARRLAWSGWVALLVGTVSALLLQGPYGGALPLSSTVDPAVIGTTMSTRMGVVLLTRLVVLGLGAVGLAVLLARGASADTRARAVKGGVVVAFALALAATWSSTDHAGTGSQVLISLPLGTAHLAAMAVWVGGLTMLVAVLLRSRDVAAMREALPRFSTTALVCVGVLVVTGTYQAWRQVGVLGAFTTTTYGRLLLTKIGLVVVLVFLGNAARSWIQRHYEVRTSRRGDRPKLVWRKPAAGEVVQLRRSVFAEVCIAVVVLGITVVLVNSVPARNAYIAPATATMTYVAGAGVSGRGTVSMSVDTPRVGRTTVHLRVRNLTGVSQDVAELTPNLYLSAQRLGPLPFKVSRVDTGDYVASDVPLPLPGHWQLAIGVRFTDINQTTVVAPVDVR